MKYEDDLRDYLVSLDRIKPVILCGDLNVAHNEIDLKNPGPNRGNPGFSDEERAKMTELLSSGFTDSFRFLYPDRKDAYSWWSYRAQSRDRNIGWRIDYFIVSKRLEQEIEDAGIMPDISEEKTGKEGESLVSLLSVFPEDTTVWLDSSDMYRKEEFFGELTPFRKVFIDVPLSVDTEGRNVIGFGISPQPVFNKNFELLSGDIRSRIEHNYKVYIFSDKASQIDRLKGILGQEDGILPEFVSGKNIHSGFIDAEDNYVF